MIQLCKYCDLLSCVLIRIQIKVDLTTSGSSIQGELSLQKLLLEFTILGKMKFKAFGLRLWFYSHEKIHAKCSPAPVACKPFRTRPQGLHRMKPTPGPSTKSSTVHREHTREVLLLLQLTCFQSEVYAMPHRFMGIMSFVPRVMAFTVSFFLPHVVGTAWEVKNHL